MKISPQLCVLSTTLPKSDDWLFELKYDGYRIIAATEAGAGGFSEVMAQPLSGKEKTFVPASVRLLTRNGNDYTKKFQTIADSLAGLGDFVLDGEVASSAFPPKENPVYFVFDLLFIDGEDLRGKPLKERKEKLKKLLKSAPGNIRYVDHVKGVTEKVFETLCGQNHEGLIAKRENSIYSGTRNGDWLKIKCPGYNRKNAVGNLSGAPQINITSPDKKMFGDFTKKDVFDYYTAVAQHMLPYIKNRVLSLVRCPNGIKEPCFYKKNPETGKHIIIKTAEELLKEVQLNTLEFHAVFCPDIMVFDLDPDEGMSLSKIREGAEDLKSILDGLSLMSYLKTSGGKGYHVVVPLAMPDLTAFKEFSKKIAEYMEQRWPGKYTSNVRKQSRQGKIFVDYLRNGKGATSVAPYSLRAREGARVSMPIAWSELYKIAPDGITMSEAVNRLAKPDPWKSFTKTQN